MRFMLISGWERSSLALLSSLEGSHLSKVGKMNENRVFGKSSTSWVFKLAASQGNIDTRVRENPSVHRVDENEVLFQRVALEKDCQIDQTNADLCSGRGELLCTLTYLQTSHLEASYPMC